MKLHFFSFESDQPPRGLGFNAVYEVIHNGMYLYLHFKTYEPRHEISNNVICATIKGSDQPVHTRSLIRAFASRLNIQ